MVTPLVSLLHCFIITVLKMMFLHYCVAWQNNTVCCWHYYLKLPCLCLNRLKEKYTKDEEEHWRVVTDLDLHLHTLIRYVFIFTSFFKPNTPVFTVVWKSICLFSDFLWPCMFVTLKYFPSSNKFKYMSKAKQQTQIAFLHFKYF